MKRISLQLALLLLSAFTLPALAQSVSRMVLQQTMTDKGWPRTFTNGATSFSIYQPQIEQWKDNQFAARASGQQRWDTFRSSGGLNGNSGVVGPRAGSGGGGFGAGGGPRGGGRIRR